MREHILPARIRLVRGLTVGAVLTGLVATSVSAATTEVSVNDTKRFDPPTVNQAVGHDVHWTWTGTDDHSVTHDLGLFDSGVGPGLEFDRTFSAGTYAYHCQEHVDQGMRGVVRVRPRILVRPRGLPFSVQWATSASNTGNRFRVMYRVGAGRWRTWVRNTSAARAVFGARSHPVRVLRGRRYSFRAASGSTTVKSALSPVKSFRAR